MANEYDFILNPGGNPSRKGASVPGNGTQRILILVAIIGGLLVVGLFAVLSLFGGQPDNKDQLLKVAQQQQELIRVSKIGVKEARGVEARNLAMTTQLSLSTDQAPLLAALEKQKVKVAKKQLDGLKDAKTDKMLETATNNNRFDEEFTDYIQQQLVDYQKNLSAAYRDTVGPNLKETLKVNYEHASILIGVDPET